MLRGIKKLDRNRAVLGQLQTWIHLLTESAGMFENNCSFIQLAKPEPIEIDVGIDDEAWLVNEDPDEAARLQAAESNSLF